MNSESFDYYKSAMALIDVLDRGGLSVEASRIQKALEDGSTGTEIMMTLQWCLKEMVALELSWPDTTRQRAIHLLEKLNIALK